MKYMYVYIYICNIGIAIKYLVFMYVEIFAHVNVICFFLCVFFHIYFLKFACCCYCYAIRAFFLDCLKKLIIYLLLICEKNNIYMHMQVCM